MYSHMLMAEHSGIYLHSLDPSQYNHTVDRASLYILVNKANSVHNLFLNILRINCAPSWLYLHEHTERMRTKTNTNPTICTAVHNHRIRISYYTDQKYGKGQRLLINMCNSHKLSVKIFLYRKESVTLEISFQ